MVVINAVGTTKTLAADNLECGWRRTLEVEWRCGFDASWMAPVGKYQTTSRDLWRWEWAWYLVGSGCGGSRTSWDVSSQRDSGKIMRSTAITIICTSAQHRSA